MRAGARTRQRLLWSSLVTLPLLAAEPGRARGGAPAGPPVIRVAGSRDTCAVAERAGPVPARPGRQIVASSLVIVLALWGIGSWLSWRSYAAERDSRVDDVRRRAGEAAALVQASLDGEISTLRALAASPVVVDQDRAGMREYFRRADPEGAAAGGGFGWVDRAGRLQVLLAFAPDQPPPDLSNRSYVPRTIESGRPQVGDAVLSGGTVPIVVVTAPTFDAGGALTGLVLRAQKLDASNALVRALRELPDVRVLDASGQVVVDDGPIDTGRLELAPAGVPRGVSSVGSVGVEPGRRVAATAPVGATGWTAVVDPSSHDLLGALRRALVVQLVGIAVVAVFAFGAMCVLARKSQRTADLNRTLEEANRRSGALQRIGDALAGSLTPREVGQVVTQEVRHALGADAASLGWVDHAERRVQFLSLAGYPDAVVDGRVSMPLDTRAAVTDAVREGRTVVRDARTFAEHYPHLVADLVQSEISSVLAVPLVVAGETVGVLGLGWRSAVALAPEQLQFAETVAGVVGRSTARALVYDAAHETTLALQRSVQAAPLRTDYLRSAGRYRPASTGPLGGDWFDVLELPRGRTFLAVGDVVGHGLEAAEDMAQLRNAARAFAVSGLEPSEILLALDRFCAVATKGRFATAAVALVDPVRAEVTYARGGHPPPLLRRADATVLALGDTTGAPLGATMTAAYDQRTCPLGPGDALVLYTDGLVERRGRTVDEGIEALTGALAALDPAADVDAVAVALLDHSAGDGRPRDDQCVLVAAFDASTAPGPGPLAR